MGCRGFSFSFAEHHKLVLKERQPIAELELTSVTLGEDTSVINARIGIITGLFDRKSEYRIRPVT
jgi:hypothetical protein